MKTLLMLYCFAFGILDVCTSEMIMPDKITTTKQIADDTTTTNTAASASAPVAIIALTNETKDKRETKDTKVASNVYSNHRSDTQDVSVRRSSNTNSDDPEDPQETVYGTNARQFLIRPQHQSQFHHHQQQQQQHQQQRQQQNEEEHLPPQLRNYPATIRPHSTQLLEQSQEIQHYAYLQDINRNHQHKVQNQGKSQVTQTKKAATANIRAGDQASQVDEAEQRYTVAVEQPIPLNPRNHLYRQQIPYQLATTNDHQQQQQAKQQNSAQSQEQQYQIIPEEQFLKLLEEELQAQAYHENQVRRQQVVLQQSQRRQQQQKQASAAAEAASQKVALQAQGLGSYKQRIESDEDVQQEYIQYVHKPKEGPKYLSLPQRMSQEEKAEQELAPSPQLPPQLAYYQSQISYKTLPNHPLAKSTLEKEIEMLLASNKPNIAPVQIVDNSNEPSAPIRHHNRAPSPARPQPSAKTPISSKAYLPSTTKPTGLLDANNQAFVPSLFSFSNYPQSRQNYPVPISQQVIDAKKLGPVVYPPQSRLSSSSPSPSVQPSVQAPQFYYQEAVPSPSPRSKVYRPKYGTRFTTTSTPLKAHHNEINYPVSNKYGQPLYDIERPAPLAVPGSAASFYPSPPDPHKNISPTTQSAPAVAGKFATPTDFQQFALPGPSSSQSNIYVSQGTGIATPTRPIIKTKPKTVDDLKQLRLPQPGDKPLTQAEFQALVDEGYPITAVPVPVPIPYEQYVKDHPDYRNQPPPQPPTLPVNYEQLMRFAQLQQHHQVPHFGPHRPSHPRALIGRPSEPSVKIVSLLSEPQTVMAVGGGSVTYLRAIPENQKRRPREETETKVLGAKKEEKEKDEIKQLEENENK